MSSLFDSPFAIFALALASLVSAAKVGEIIRKRLFQLSQDRRADLGDVLTATMTLLALLIGFSFSMAVNRYDQRKNYEEAEANAVGTELVRADLLPAADAAKIRQLLAKYLDLRILFYETSNRDMLARLQRDEAELQSQLWSVAATAAKAQPTPVTALAVGGMNDVLNSQGYTMSAWRNRIPIAAWALMGAVALCCNGLLGFHARQPNLALFLISPMTIAIAFFLIADIDSPRGGVIRVLPQNLISLAQSVNPQ